MNALHILVVDDDRPVLESVDQELSPFRKNFSLSLVESAEVAQEKIDAITREGGHLAILICSHVLPGEYGIDFLVRLHQNLRLTDARKVLMTRRANLQETIRGINEGNLNYYLTKPWDNGKLSQVVRDQLTDYFIRTRLNPMPFMDQLNSLRVLEAVHEGIFRMEE